MTALKIRRTASGCNYFEGKGAYQKEYDELWERHVPASGMARTLNGELIRAIGRLTYEYFNNGNFNARVEHCHTEETDCCYCHGSGTIDDEDGEGNAIEVECPECGGSGYFCEECEDEPTIAPMYAAFIRLIEESVPGTEATMEMVADVIYECSPSDSNSRLFSDNRVGFYSEMADTVVSHVLETPDRELPGWYVEEMGIRNGDCNEIRNDGAGVRRSERGAPHLQEQCRVLSAQQGRRT